MQKRMINKIEGGEERVVEINVLRSWGDASGAMIHQLADGMYAYNNGDPVRSAEDFNLLGEGIQKEMALQWWDQAGGKEMSARFYRIRAEAEKERVGKFAPRPDTAALEAELDRVMYRCRPAGQKKKGEWSAPFVWSARFPSRPDWWGQAVAIAYKDWEYEMAGMDGTDGIEAGEI